MSLGKEGFPHLGPHAQRNRRPSPGYVFGNGLIFFVMGTVILVCVALAAGAARDRLARSTNTRRVLNGLAATAFGGLGLRLIFSGNTA